MKVNTPSEETKLLLQKNERLWDLINYQAAQIQSLKKQLQLKIEITTANQIIETVSELSKEQPRNEKEVTEIKKQQQKQKSEKASTIVEKIKDPISIQQAREARCQECKKKNCFYDTQQKNWYVTFRRDRVGCHCESQCHKKMGKVDSNLKPKCENQFVDSNVEQVEIIVQNENMRNLTPQQQQLNERIQKMFPGGYLQHPNYVK